MEDQEFQFTVIPAGHRIPAGSHFYQAFLIEDNWDDWFRFNTLYSLIIYDAGGTPHSLGQVKIGQFEMQKDQRRPAIPEIFITLDHSFLSLGQDDSYYEGLNNLGDVIRNRVLNSLRDVAADSDLFNRALPEDVTAISLLRSVSIPTVRGQFSRLAIGGARLTSFKFVYTPAKHARSEETPMPLRFDVDPDSNPPTNVHVLIGRNGVGKTHLLNRMTRALVEREAKEDDVGSFSFFEIDNTVALFSNLVSVTFSAFDSFEPLPQQQTTTSAIKYFYVGLKQIDQPKADVPKSPKMLADEFVRSVRICLQGAKNKRWQRALQTLEADPIFREAEVSNLALQDEDFANRAGSLFGKLSSGHKIVLLTITRLVETVEEKTLVLMDEPEAHLHPPLLSALVRALADLLSDRNGVAIIATHSPVVLQEVPMSCVWKLRRGGFQSISERPEIETFGENVGILTREVFGLEVTESGFHKLIEDAVANEFSYDAVIERFNNSIGAEGQAIARTLFIEKDKVQDT